MVQECREGTLLGVPQHDLWHLPSALSNAMASLCTLHRQVFVIWTVHTTAILCSLVLKTPRSPGFTIHPNNAYEERRLC